MAVAGAVAAVGAGAGAALEFNVDAHARALAITARTCALTYDKPPSPDSDHGNELGGGYNGLGSPAAYIVGPDGQPVDRTDGAPVTASAAAIPFDFRMRVTQETIRCLRNGAYIPGGAVVDTSRFEAGEQERLLRGYIDLEEAEADNFNPGWSIIGAIATGSIGAYFAARMARFRRGGGEEEEPDGPDDDEARSDEVEGDKPRGIYDQFADERDVPREA